MGGIREELGELKEEAEQVRPGAAVSFGIKTAGFQSPESASGEPSERGPGEPKQSERTGGGADLERIKGFVGQLEAQFESQIDYIRRLEARLSSGRALLTDWPPPSPPTSRSHSHSHSRSPRLASSSKRRSCSPRDLHSRGTIASQRRAKASQQTRKALRE